MAAGSAGFRHVEANRHQHPESDRTNQFIRRHATTLLCVRIALVVVAVSFAMDGYFELAVAAGWMAKHAGKDHGTALSAMMKSFAERRPSPFVSQNCNEDEPEVD